MCQMCEDYEAELRRMGIAMDQNLTIRLNDHVVEELRRRADLHGRDVADEVRAIVLEKVAGTVKPVDFVEEFRRIRAMSPQDAVQSDSTRLIRYSRDHDH